MEEVDAYIRQHYDYDVLKCVYINSDGAGWIRAAADYVGKSKLVADRFHLMKYINRVARYTLDEETITKGRFYKYIYKNKFLAAKKLLTRIKNHCEGSGHAVEECRKYLSGNWEYHSTCVSRQTCARLQCGRPCKQRVFGTDEFQANGMERDGYGQDV